MTLFRRQTYPAIEKALAVASELARQGRAPESFRHLERAHILGQSSTVQHVRVHWEMLRWGWQHGDTREVCGQILRIVGTALVTPLGMLPLGNTGGANVSPFRSMPIPQNLVELLPPKRPTKAPVSAIAMIAASLLTFMAISVALRSHEQPQREILGPPPLTIRVVGHGRPAVVFLRTW